MATFNDLLRTNGIDPREVSLLRHKTEVRGLGLSDFERYQQTQLADQPVFRQPRYWASFVAEPGLRTRFVGLYEVAFRPGEKARWDDPLTGQPVGADKPGKEYDLFETRRCAALSEHIDRLSIDWNASERSWAQHARSNEKRIILPPAITPKTPSAGRVPDIIPQVDSTTSRAALALARVGQGKFRRDLLEIWQGRCALTGCDLPPLLRASHIKAWAGSIDEERLDPANGLLLAVHIDALFDLHLISFDSGCKLVRSDRIGKPALAALGISPEAKLVGVHPRTARYLRGHHQRLLRSGRA